ncbi:MAG: hypothetical protein H3C36_15440, partial [Chitinophagaceae bacterium]|nr:hypothetical protein [Chitinophagaceae bacterium]
MRPAFLGRCTFILVTLLFTFFNCIAQERDSSSKKNGGILNDVLNIIRTDTAQPDRLNLLLRSDQLFIPYNGYTIRN